MWPDKPEYDFERFSLREYSYAQYTVLNTVSTWVSDSSILDGKANCHSQKREIVNIAAFVN